MNVILGLNCNHADSSACIIKNNELAFGIEEEQSYKTLVGLTESIRELLKTNTKLSEVIETTVNANPIHIKIFIFLNHYIKAKKI